MPDTIIESVLSGKLQLELLIKWLNNESIEDAPDDCILLCCTKSEFVAYFLTYIRNQTDSILQTNSNAVQILQNSTPEKLLSSRRKHRRSTSEPTSDERTDSLSIKNDSKSHHESPNRDKKHESPNRDRKRTGRRVKTKLFEDKSNSNVSVSSDESRLSMGVDKIVISTPMKNGFKPEFISSPVTPRSVINSSYDRCDTPRLSRHSKSHEKCFGDFLVSATKSTKKKNKKTSSNDSEGFDLDLSNSDIFPDIGARKSSSLRSGRRIKPTNIDKSQKSLSLNSFNSECFQQPPLALQDNSVFKHQKFQPKETNFEAERSLLRQDRHKVMEKFNLLNTSTPKVSAGPQIKKAQKESIEIAQSYIKADVTKVVMKDKIDCLIDIYDVLLKNNLILSINTEIYFLISILVSKQVEADYLMVESKLNGNCLDCLLKSIHNSTYFAVKSLWNQKVILEVILDKNSLKTLGENKKVRSFYPELAKSLLNRYCVVCEKVTPRPTPRPPAVVAYNCETDNADNFPSAQATQLFKKQRDAFYDVVRWHHESWSAGAPRAGLRARVRALLSHAASVTNHAHLATLLVAHMLATCLPTDAQESKLSKLQRRLTCPTSAESNRAPHFTNNELFYKEFITHAESESFRVHLKDALCTEIVGLDGTHIPLEDRGNSNNLDITREYLQLAKKLALLAKFLGYLTSLPYSHVATESKSSVVNVASSGEVNFAAPKEKVLENNIGLRNYSQPSIDLMGLLQNSIENARLSITIPWLVHYLSMLDYTTLRLKYYNALLKTIFDIYYNKLKINQIDLKRNTVIYLKSILGWLFDLNHIPNDINYNVIDVGTSDGVDSCDLIDEAAVIELCPSLKDVNLLLSTCRFSQEQKEMGSFRHITPVSLSVNPEDRIKNKEKELQARLEEELLKSQPSSTRRVIEMVVERVTSAAVKEITARELVAAREHAREHARRMLAASAGESHAVLLQKTTTIYSSQLHSVRSSALCSQRAVLAGRARSALAALLPAAAPPLHTLAAKMANRALVTWLHHHTNTTTILCKDIEAEMRALISMNEMQITPSVENAADSTAITAAQDVFDATHTSVATPLIHLKEHICLVLEDAATADVTSLIALCARGCSGSNIFCRAPAQRAILQLSVDLCIVYVSKKPHEITETFLNKLHAIWNTCCPDRKHYSPEETTLPERREEISPQLRNFEDDERMATPISDDENVITNGHINDDQDAKQPITYLQPIKSSSQPKWQPIKLQPINTKHQHLPKSQPASPMLQPSTKWIHTSRSQPVSPKLQPVYSQPIYPAVPIMKPNSPVSKQTNQLQQPISPVSKPINQLQKPISPVSKPINQLQKPISPVSKPINQLQKPISPVTNDSEVKELNADSELLECFDRILCPRNIVLLSVTNCDKSVVWDAMATVLVYLLKNDYLSEDSLTEQCLAVYRQDWPQNILESLSACMRSVSTRWSRSTAGKFTLFLDFLAEYCGDMDYELQE